MNWIYDGRYFRIIDFGETRLGHPYFDLAATLTSFSDFPTKEEVDSFLHEYEFYHDTVQRDLLKLFIDLWLIRGILTVNTQDKHNQIISFWMKQQQHFTLLLS